MNYYSIDTLQIRVCDKIIYHSYILAYQQTPVEARLSMRKENNLTTHGCLQTGDQEVHTYYSTPALPFSQEKGKECGIIFYPPRSSKFNKWKVLKGRFSLLVPHL